MLKHINSRKQGDEGLGQAIAYFCSLGHSVSVPLTESQRYDLVVDDGENLSRVEVKTTRYRNGGEKASYKVVLSTQGGNQSWGKVVRKISRNDSDYVFVLVENGEKYLIPTFVLDDKACLCLTSRMDVYKI